MRAPKFSVRTNPRCVSGCGTRRTVGPYVEKMTRSELLTLMACGMSTVASTTMALYVSFLSDGFPLIAGHLISASVMSIPAAALVSRGAGKRSEGEALNPAKGEQHGV